jgi:hypothetical protein
MVKYKKLTEKVYSNLPWQAQAIVGEMLKSASFSFKSTLLDFKVRQLDEGDCGCPLEGWHIDVTRNPNHPSKSDRHLIYSTIVGTEFLLDKIETDAIDFAEVGLEGKSNIWQAPANSIVAYDRLNLHRGPIVREPCKRVLIRLTQTDII